MKARTKIHFIFSILIVSLVLQSCFKKEEYPIEPNIAYDSFKVFGDSATLTFNFTDGDGDLGLNDSDTLAPYDISSEFHYNIYVNYYEKDDQQGWVQGLDLDGNPVVFRYRMEPVITKGKSKGIKGKIEIGISNGLYYNPLSDQSDTLKYDIQLIDKALHKSNIIESEVIIR